MASRRMFSLDVVDTDSFLEMPLTAQCLYFHMGMRADDDGFIDSPKRMLRYIGSNDDDLRILLSKGYLIPFEDGVIVIKDWLKNNWVRPDRKKNTRYTEKLALLAVEDDSYILDLSAANQTPTNCQPSGIPVDNQTPTNCQPSDIPRLGKDSIDYIVMSKDITRTKKCNQHEKKREKTPCQDVVDLYNSICISLPRVTKLSEARKKAIHARYSQYSIGDFKKLFEMAEESSFLKGGGNRNWVANFDWLMRDSNMAKVLDGNYADREAERNKSRMQDGKPYQQFSQRECNKDELGELEKMLLQKGNSGTNNKKPLDSR
ncbi:hypothetical protein D7V86_05985 [bacterium D16-51]|nr:hypothetical protein D7V96_06690 [bacterium D16-59]RKI61328.1 hypothetical protein D7V86_05985 [bacterium D16-51]